MSFCASIESRGYGTMTSIDPMRPDNLRRRDPTSYKSSEFVRKSESRISFSPEMIAPPCSVNRTALMRIFSTKNYFCKILKILRIFSNVSYATKNLDTLKIYTNIKTHIYSIPRRNLIIKKVPKNVENAVKNIKIKRGWNFILTKPILVKWSF